MDTVLLAVTVISLAAAFVSIMALQKLKRTDQLRSDARVAALMAAADATPAATAAGWNSVAGEMQWNPAPSSVVSGFPTSLQASADRRSLGVGGSRTVTPAEPGEVRLKADTTGAPAPASENFFGTVQREQPASPRFAFAAAFAVIVALTGAVIVFTSSNHEKAAAPVARAAHASPLELVSLNHSRDASALTISGVVRNPVGGPTLEGLTAVVSLIDEHGGLISTKDVPLDYRALGPGEEAPFKITVPDAGSIARYRVSFRAGTDVIPHVDRRTDTKLASAL